MADLLKMIEELKCNPLISIKQCEIGNPLSDANIYLIESGFDLKIPKNLINFLRKHDGIKLTWATDENYNWNRMSGNDFTIPYGKIYIPDLETMIADPYYGQWKGYFWGEEIALNIDEETREYYKTFIPFDFPGIELDRSTCICMKKEKDESIDTNLLLYESHSGPMSFDYNLEEYIDLLHQTKGFECWQYAANGNQQYREIIEHYFPQVFPNQPIPIFKVN
jgi:hypothetical protein